MPQIHRTLRLVAVVLAVSVTGAPLARAVDGVAADRTFGSDGVVALDMPGRDHPIAMVKTATGRLAVAIQSGPSLWVAMLTADGRLDASFAGAGLRRVKLADGTRGAGLQPTSDGGVLIAAWLRDGDSVANRDERLGVAKLRPDGSIDDAYGTGGLATTAVGELTPFDLGPIEFAAAPDGSTIVLGSTGVGSYFGAIGVAALLRFTADGKRDTSFGVNGVAPVVNDAAYPILRGLAIDAAGAILVAETNHTVGPPRTEALVRRFTSRGMPDVAFGVAGVAHLPIPGDTKWITDLSIDNLGRIVVFGFAAGGLPGQIADRLNPSGPVDPDAGLSPVLARLRPDGRPDTTFGSHGIALLHDNGHGNPLSWSGDIALTRAGAYVTAYGEHSSHLRTELLRVNARGRVDPRYGGSASVRLPMENTFAVVVLAGRVVVAGESSSEVGGSVLAAFRR